MFSYKESFFDDEEEIVGYFKPEDPDTIKFYSNPSFYSDELKKEKNKRHENWKYNNSTSCNMTLEQMDDTFGNIYNVEGSELLIGRSNSIWGWEEIKDKENQITWIRIDQYEQVWAPFNSYDNSTSDEEEEEEDNKVNEDMIKLANSNPLDQEENEEVSKLFGSSSDDEIKNLCTECGIDMGPCNPRQLCGKTRCLEPPEDVPPAKKQKT